MKMKLPEEDRVEAEIGNEENIIDADVKEDQFNIPEILMAKEE